MAQDINEQFRQVTRELEKLEEKQKTAVREYERVSRAKADLEKKERAVEQDLAKAERVKQELEQAIGMHRANLERLRNDLESFEGKRK